ncbi:HNH endonuclease [Paraburkholderia sediminicola]|uniref:HNH endonuclease n=1 Tax=Paraburkholderia sediminicola TaxID=458836 RepID=UPI0038B9376C
MAQGTQYFSINTDLTSYRKHRERHGNPFRLWLQYGCGYMTPQPDNIDDVRDRLLKVKPGDVLFAYENDTGHGFVAIGIALEHWDEKDHRGERPELYGDSAEMWQIKVDWHTDYSFTVAALDKAGRGSPQGIIVHHTGRDYQTFLADQHAQWLAKRSLTITAHREAREAEKPQLDPVDHARTLLSAAIAGVPDVTDDGYNDDDPLQVVWRARVVSVSKLFALPPGVAPEQKDLRLATLAGATFCAAPDPLDTELDSLLSRDDLSTEAKREIMARIGQGRFRAALLRVYGKRCVVTGVSTPAVLRAAHIHRWADCRDTPDDRRNTDNGLLLTANLDALFEVGLITFEDDGEIVISSHLDLEELVRFGIRVGMGLRHTPSPAQRLYLQKHRTRTSAMR